jgi:hypothetical protein
MDTLFELCPRAPGASSPGLYRTTLAQLRDELTGG